MAQKKTSAKIAEELRAKQKELDQARAAEARSAKQANQADTSAFYARMKEMAARMNDDVIYESQGLKAQYFDQASCRSLKDNHLHMETLTGSIEKIMAQLYDLFEKVGEQVNDRIATLAMIQKQEKLKQSRRTATKERCERNKRQRQEAQEFRRAELERNREIDLFEPNLLRNDEKDLARFQHQIANGEPNKPVHRPCGVEDAMNAAMARLHVRERAEGEPEGKGEGEDRKHGDGAGEEGKRANPGVQNPVPPQGAAAPNPNPPNLGPFSLPPPPQGPADKDMILPNDGRGRMQIENPFLAGGGVNL